MQFIIRYSIHVHMRSIINIVVKKNYLFTEQKMSLDQLNKKKIIKVLDLINIYVFLKQCCLLENICVIVCSFLLFPEHNIEIYLFRCLVVQMILYNSLLSLLNNMQTVIIYQNSVIFLSNYGPYKSNLDNLNM